MSLKKNQWRSAYNAASKNDTRMFSPSVEKSICINDAANASTSNESILLSEVDRRHKEALDDRYSDIKNNKCEDTSIIVDTRIESRICKSILRTRSNSKVKDFISLEVDKSDSMEHNTEGEIVAKRSKTNLNSRNKVPESCKLVTMQNAACKTELMPECPSGKVNLDCASKTFSRKKLLSSVTRNKPETSLVETKSTDVLATSKNNVNSVDKNVPDKNKRDFQQGRINDRIASNNFTRRSIDDNISSMEVQDQIVNDQYGTLSDARTATGDQETDKIESGVTALPAKPTKSLPSDLKASIEDNNIKSNLVKAKDKLPSSTQSFTERMQSTAVENAPRSTGGCTELVIRRQISSHGDTSMRESISEARDENLNKNAAHRDACTASETNARHDEQSQSAVVQNVKRKRGRPRKVINDLADQSTPNRIDTSREIPESITESVTRDKRRASRIRITNDISDSSTESDTTENIFVKKRGRPPGASRGQGRGHGRGRGRGRPSSRNSLDTEYIPRLTTNISQSRTIESDKTDDTSATANHANIKNAPTDSSAPNVQLVSCAKCDKEIPKKQWSSHNLHQHNNMAWRKDQEPLDFENDPKLLKRVLSAALKQKKKFLICEKCEDRRQSVLGFISHMQFCGKSEEEKQSLMVTCPICNRVMMPSSVEVHERFHRQAEQNKDKVQINVQVERTKRKAAERAVPRILELAESLKEQNNDVVQIPQKKRIPSAWKVMWKKELDSKGVMSCKQLGCTFTCSSYETIYEHYYQCNFRPKEKFMCKICKFCAESKDKIIDHITEIHSGNNDVEKYSDYETEEDENSDESIFEDDLKQKFSSRRSLKINSDSTNKETTCRKMAFLDKETTQNSLLNEIYEPTLRWTLEFELKNYELALFEDNMPNCFTLLGNNDAATYLPELTISMAFKHANSSENMENSDDKNWMCMNRFESDICEDVPIFFVGGPIWALAWLPIPSPMYSKNPMQYIAISTHPTMESEYEVRCKYSGPNIIQIWDVGPLNHKVNSENKSPVLAYAIAHNSGTVWCLEWCPSGCYQDVDLGNYKAGGSDLRRMGLLAAACSDGCIHIYSLPFADELKFEKTEDNSWPIYKTDPVITLVKNILMYDNNEQNWQCTRLSWTKEHGHNFIAAGFSNGYIGLWHLTTVSPLLLDVRNDTKVINTYHYFFAHFNAITMVALVPYGNRRFLATASVDKSYKFWDLEDTTAPQSCIKRGIVSNGVWMTNWPCAVLSFDDALGYHYMHSMTVPVREYGYKYGPILATNSTTYGLSVSDHANSIAHSTLAGEVLTIFPHQLLYPEKLLSKKRQLNSFIKTVDFLEEQQHGKDSKSQDKKSSKEYYYMPEKYDECKDRFGIIFHDNLTDLEKSVARGKQKDSLNSDKMMSVPIEQYPFTSANRVAWNPNTWSYLWLAIGYQNGLVRLLNFNFMSSRHDLNVLLPPHVKSMLDKKRTS